MISYAQNLEDVVLNRLFQNKPSGFYIDIGAHDPTELSVTKHFYDLGWRGINIEPIPGSLEKFKQQRPGDINLNLAIGTRHDIMSIYEVLGHPELSTLDTEIAIAAGLKVGAEIRSRTIEVRTLAEICEKHCNELIDFIKIDVEGGERDVILGADWKKFRPTMLVVESTIPNSGSITDWCRADDIAAWPEWEPVLFEADYVFVYYDGLNRYYLRKEDEHLKNRFHIPMTLLQDNFSLHKDLRIAWEAQKRVNALEGEKTGLQEKVKALEGEKAGLQEEKSGLAQTIQTLEGEKTGLEEKVQTLDDEKAGLIQTVKALEGEKAGIQEEKAGLAHTIQALENDKAVLGEKVQALEGEKTGLQDEKLTLEGKIRDLESDVADQEERVVTLVEESSGLYGRVNELEAEKKSLSENLETEKKDLGQKLANAQGKSDRLGNLLEKERKTSGVLHETQQKLSNTQARIKQLEAQLAEANKVNSDLRETSEGLRRKLEKQRRLNEIVKWTLEEERTVPRLSRVIKRFLPFRSPSEVSAHAFEDRKGGLDALEDEKTGLIEKGGALELVKPGFEDNKLPEQALEDVAPSPRQTHVMVCSGWENVALAARGEVERAGLTFVSNLELALTSGKELPHGQWAAISHVPAKLPKWMAETVAYKPFTTAFFTSKAWNTAKGRCQRLFAFSEDHANILAGIGVATTALKHPLPEVAKRWSWEAFEANPEKEIIQVGWWLARMHGIHLLPESGYKKLWVRRPGPNMDDVFAAERAHLKERFIFFDHMDSSVTVSDDLPPQEYEERLCANIAFAHYYDASAPDFLLQCIAQHTPILVNALPAVREYLGDNYPLYYYFYRDAMEKASNLDLVRKAHEYLRRLSEKMDVNPEGIALQIRNTLEEN